MNDSDEDGEALKRLNARMEESNVVPPDPSEVAPAALYLTAIIECVPRLPRSCPSLTLVRYVKQVYMRVSSITSACGIPPLMYTDIC